MPLDLPASPVIGEIQIIDGTYFMWDGVVWLNVTFTRPIFPSFTAAVIGNAAAAVNTVGKLAGVAVYDSTNSRVLVASGGSPTAEWKVVDGGAGIVPA